MTYPAFNSGDILTATDMNAVGLWRVTACTATSAGGTSATASNGVVTIGTGNTSVTVNNAFSADYNNYLITVNGGNGSTSAELQFRLGTVSTGYKFSFLYSSYNNTAAAVGSATAGAIEYIGQMTPTSMGAAITVINPFLTEQTFVHGPCITDTFAGNCSGHLNNANSYTSFTLVAPIGSMTGGTIRVYGYRN